jgi:hypothetical protein
MRMPSRRVLLVTAAVAFVCGGIIWNLVFDLWLGQVERQYLYEEARHELGLGPYASLKGMMNQAVHEGAWIATGWTALVVLSIGGAAFYAYRRGREDLRIQGFEDSRTQGLEDSRVRGFEDSRKDG